MLCCCLTEVRITYSFVKIKKNFYQSFRLSFYAIVLFLCLSESTFLFFLFFFFFFDHLVDINFSCFFPFLSSSARLAELFSEIYITEVDLFVKVYFALDILGDVLFSAAFLSVLLVLSDALKLNHIKAVNVAQQTGTCLFILLTLTQAILVIAFEVTFTAAVQEYSSQNSVYFKSSSNGNSNTAPSVRQSAFESVLVDYHPVPHYLFNAAFIINGVVDLLIGGCFILTGISIYHIVQVGEAAARAKSNVSLTFMVPFVSPSPTPKKKRIVS